MDKILRVQKLKNRWVATNVVATIIRCDNNEIRDFLIQFGSDPDTNNFGIFNYFNFYTIKFRTHFFSEIVDIPSSCPKETSLENLERNLDERPKISAISRQMINLIM